MARVELRRLQHFTDIISFQLAFNGTLGYSTVPYDYFESGECHAMFVDGVMVAGFCLVRGLDNLRSWKQIPAHARAQLLAGPMRGMELNVCDFTGYFIKNKRYAMRFTVYLVWTCFKFPCRYFMYSFQTSETGLERYYGAGRPLRIHTGVPEHLPGHHAIMEEEHVEVLTKWGIVRIFLARTRRVIWKWLARTLAP